MTSQCSPEVTFDRLVQKFEDMVRSLDNVPLLDKKESLFSANRKTGFSINFPIPLTCKPTKLCARECYAVMLNKPITWNNSLLKQLKIQQYFCHTDTDVVAQRVIKEYHRRRLKWIRWCGSGDLFPEAVKVINRVCELDPSVVQLVVTRIPAMANKLCQHKNLFIMFSLDEDPESKKRQAKLKPNPRMYFSFLRTKANQDTMNAEIIFNSQKLKKVLPYDDKRRCCPVDAAQLEVEGACDKCRKCFSEHVFINRGN